MILAGDTRQHVLTLLRRRLRVELVSDGRGGLIKLVFLKIPNAFGVFHIKLFKEQKSRDILAGKESI